MNYIQTLQAQLQSMATSFVAALPSLAIALVVLLVTWVLARFASRITALLIGRTDIRPSLRNLLTTLVRVGIWLLGIMLASVIVMPGLHRRACSQVLALGP